MLSAAPAKLSPRERSLVFLVTLATLLRWHRGLVACRWAYSHTGRGVRRLDQQVITWWCSWRGRIRAGGM